MGLLASVINGVKRKRIECEHCDGARSCTPLVYVYADRLRVVSVPVGQSRQMHTEACLRAILGIDSAPWHWRRSCSECKAPIGGQHHSSCGQKICPRCDAKNVDCSCVVEFTALPAGPLQSLGFAMGWISTAHNLNRLSGPGQIYALFDVYRLDSFSVSQLLYRLHGLSSDCPSYVQYEYYVSQRPVDQLEKGQVRSLRLSPSQTAKPQQSREYLEHLDRLRSLEQGESVPPLVAEPAEFPDKINVRKTKADPEYKLYDYEHPLYKKLPDPDPKLALKQYQNAWAYEREGEIDDALSAFTESVRNDPTLVKSWLALGRVRFVVGRPTVELRWCYETVLELEPSNSDARLGLARCLRLEGTPLAALAISDEVLGVHADSAEAWLQRAKSLTALKRYPDALAALDRVIELEPSRSGLWTLRAACQRNARGLRSVLGTAVRSPRRLQLDAIGEAISLASTHGVTLEAAQCVVDGATLAEQGELKAGLELLSKATTLAPQFQLAWRYEARCLQFQGSYDEAALRYRKCVALGREVRDLEGLACCHHALGQYKEALENFELAISENPKDTAAWLGKSLSQEALSQRVEALATYEHYLRLSTAKL